MSATAIEVLHRLYEFLLWYTHKLAAYPKKFKYTLGERITNTFLDVLERIIEAKYHPGKRRRALTEANLALEKLRFLIRLSKDLQCISLREYEYAARQMQEIGKQIGGWQKYG